jgi:hypothetical protein
LPTYLIKKSSVSVIFGKRPALSLYFGRNKGNRGSQTHHQFEGNSLSTSGHPILWYWIVIRASAFCNYFKNSARMFGCCEKISLEPLVKRFFRPNSSLCSKIYPRNIGYIPAVKFFACLDFERKSLFCKRLSILHRTTKIRIDAQTKLRRRALPSLADVFMVFPPTPCSCKAQMSFIIQGTRDCASLLPCQSRNSTQLLQGNHNIIQPCRIVTMFPYPKIRLHGLFVSLAYEQAG